MFKGFCLCLSLLITLPAWALRFKVKETTVVVETESGTPVENVKVDFTAGADVFNFGSTPDGWPDWGNVADIIEETFETSEADGRATFKERTVTASVMHSNPNVQFYAQSLYGCRAFSEYLPLKKKGTDELCLFEAEGSSAIKALPATLECELGWTDETLTFVQDITSRICSPMPADRSLIQSVKDSNVSGVREALANGAHPNLVVPDGDGGSRGSTVIDMALWENNTEIIQLLFTSPDFNPAYRSSIHDLAHIGNWELMKFYLENVADPGVNARGFRGSTPLHETVHYAKKIDTAKGINHLKVVELLLLHGADPSLDNEDEKTPLEWAQSLYNSSSRGADAKITLSQIITLLEAAVEIPEPQEQ